MDRQTLAGRPRKAVHTGEMTDSAATEQHKGVADFKEVNGRVCAEPFIVPYEMGRA